MVAPKDSSAAAIAADFAAEYVTGHPEGEDESPVLLASTPPTASTCSLKVPPKMSRSIPPVY